MREIKLFGPSPIPPLPCFVAQPRSVAGTSSSRDDAEPAPTPHQITANATYAPWCNRKSSILRYILEKNNPELAVSEDLAMECTDEIEKQFGVKYPVKFFMGKMNWLRLECIMTAPPPEPPSHEQVLELQTNVMRTSTTMVFEPGMDPDNLFDRLARAQLITNLILHETTRKVHTANKNRQHTREGLRTLTFKCRSDKDGSLLPTGDNKGAPHKEECKYYIGLK